MIKQDVIVRHRPGRFMRGQRPGLGTGRDRLTGHVTAHLPKRGRCQDAKPAECGAMVTRADHAHDRERRMRRMTGHHACRPVYGQGLVCAVPPWVRIDDPRPFAQLRGPNKDMNRIPPGQRIKRSAIVVGYWVDRRAAEDFSGVFDAPGMRFPVNGICRARMPLVSQKRADLHCAQASGTRDREPSLARMKALGPVSRTHRGLPVMACPAVPGRRQHAPRRGPSASPRGPARRLLPHRIEG